MVFRGGKWISVSGIDPSLRTAVSFSTIKLFHANIIGYIRVLMCVVAGFTAVYTELHLLTASLILGSILLDWLDGPVARAYGQCTIFGSGIDWAADILGQVAAAGWYLRYESSALPWLMIALAVEIITGLFDFAVSATAKYPLLKARQTGFFYILEWAMPQGCYTGFGTFLWLAYPIFMVLGCLEKAYAISPSAASFAAVVFLLNRYVMLVPTILYIWCEAAYGLHILRTWTEPSRLMRPAVEDILYDDSFDEGVGGCVNYGILAADKRIKLVKLKEQVWARKRTAIEASIKAREIFWINLWARLANEPENYETLEEAMGLAREMHEKYFGEDDSILDGIGFILNPCGSRLQEWHIDYQPGAATIFIPMTQLTPENCPQYIKYSQDVTEKELADALADLEYVDLLPLQRAGYSVRQCIAPIWSILKMDYGTIHRGITNVGTDDRVMFYMSVVKQRDADKIPLEHSIQVAKKYN